MTLEQLQKDIHDNAKQKGFWDSPREFGTMIALIHSELSEALEADRTGDFDGVCEELADAVIRILDTAEGLGIPLSYHIREKMGFNRLRERLHGNLY